MRELLFFIHNNLMKNQMRRAIHRQSLCEVHKNLGLFLLYSISLSLNSFSLPWMQLTMSESVSSSGILAK